MQNSDPVKRQLFLFIKLCMHKYFGFSNASYTHWDELCSCDEENIFSIEKSKSVMKNIPSYYKIRKDTGCDEIKAEFSRGSLLLKDDINALKTTGINISQKKMCFREKPDAASLSQDTEIDEEILKHKKSYTVVLHQYQVIFELENISDKFIPKTVGAIKLYRLTRIIRDMLSFETNYCKHIQLMFNKIDYIERYCDKVKTSEALTKQFNRDLKILSEIGIVVKRFNKGTYIISAPRDDDYWEYFAEEKWENLENDFQEDER